MKRGLIDLHIHTAQSGEGITTDAVGVLERAVLKGVQTLSITDHNTTEGCIEVLEEISNNPDKYKDVKFIPGIEITCDTTEALNYMDNNNVKRSTLASGVHVLGYNIDPYNPKFREIGALYQSPRGLKTLAIYKYIQRYYGIDVSKKQIYNALGNQNINADNILKEILTKGDKAPLKLEKQKSNWWYNNVTMKPTEYKAFKWRVHEVLRTYNSNLPKLEGFAKQDIYEMIDLIESSGGVAVLAHPTFYRPKQELKIADFEMMKAFIDVMTNGHNKYTRKPMKGFVGLELLHGRTFDDQFRFKFYNDIANEKGLFVTGGSDTHIKKTGKESYNNTLGYILRNYSIIQLDFIDRFDEIVESPARILNHKTVDEQAELFNDYKRTEPSELIAERPISEKINTFENEINVQLFAISNDIEIGAGYKNRTSTDQLEFWLWLYELYLESVIKNKDLFFDKPDMFNNWLEYRQEYFNQVKGELKEFSKNNFKKGYIQEDDAKATVIESNATKNKEGFNNWKNGQQVKDGSLDKSILICDEVISNLTNQRISINCNDYMESVEQVISGNTSALDRAM